MRGRLEPAAREVAVVNGLTYVLVVEDDDAIRELVESVLTHGRYDVVCAQSPAEALRASQALEPALIVLDFLMPGLDGQGFIEAYRQRSVRDTPVILLSAIDNVGVVAERIGAVASFRKPFDPFDLLHAASRIMAVRAAAAVDAERAS
jgi:CheY-like chemotaxis protein